MFDDDSEKNDKVLGGTVLAHLAFVPQEAKGTFRLRR
jgi:hypothetical protein